LAMLSRFLDPFAFMSDLTCNAFTRVSYMTPIP